jgi:hypothetical protein
LQVQLDKSHPQLVEKHLLDRDLYLKTWLKSVLRSRDHFKELSRKVFGWDRDYLKTVDRKVAKATRLAFICF